MKRLSTLASALLLSASLVSEALAAPTLRSEVSVTGEIVTFGDMFEDAGADAGRPIFRAPAPGTSGLVPVGTVASVLDQLGIADYDNPGILNVRVSRSGIAVDLDLLEGLIVEDLSKQGLLAGDISVETSLDRGLPALFAAVSDQPVTLNALRFERGTGRFSARFEIAGAREAIDITGRLDLMIDAPHLTGSLPEGAILSPTDVVMRQIPLRFAESGGLAALDQLVGKQLRRSSRSGMLVKPADVMEPELIARNDAVTLFLKDGPLLLTVKGQALNNAALGESVAVLNLNSNKVIHGIAVDRGSVQVGSGPIELANL